MKKLAKGDYVEIKGNPGVWRIVSSFRNKGDEEKMDLVCDWDGDQRRGVRYSSLARSRNLPIPECRIGIGDLVQFAWKRMRNPLTVVSIRWNRECKCWSCELIGSCNSKSQWVADYCLIKVGVAESAWEE